jgi:hypothetical protein
MVWLPEDSPWFATLSVLPSEPLQLTSVAMKIRIDRELKWNEPKRRFVPMDRKAGILKLK